MAVATYANVYIIHRTYVCMPDFILYMYVEIHRKVTYFHNNIKCHPMLLLLVTVLNLTIKIGMLLWKGTHIFVYWTL